jgi:hypothetical protein
MKSHSFISAFACFILGLVLLTLMLLIVAPTGPVSAAPDVGTPGSAILAPATQTQPADSKKLADLVMEVGGLAVFLFAFTAWLKQLGVAGTMLTISAFLFGLIFGVTMRYAQAPLVTFADWFWALAFGLLAGFLATGAYKGAESVAKTDKMITATGSIEHFAPPIPHSTEE